MCIRDRLRAAQYLTSTHGRQDEGLQEDPHLDARGWTLDIEQPGVGYMKLEGPAWMSEHMGGPITFPSPDLAGHTKEIAQEVLKMNDDMIDDLIERGILEV